MKGTRAVQTVSRRIWLPGEQSHHRRQQYAASGIPLSAGVVADLSALAGELGIAPLV